MTQTTKTTQAIDDIDLGDEFAQMYQTDAKTEDEGAWFDVPGKPGWRILGRCQWSSTWRNFAAKQQQKHADRLAAGLSLTAEEIDHDIIEQIATVGVIRWEGFNGLACTPATVTQVMTKYGEFRVKFMVWAAKRSGFRQLQLKAIEGNSDSTSETA